MSHTHDITQPTQQLPAGRTETTLGNLLELIIDHRGLTPKKLGGDWSNSGYRAISAKSIKNGCLANEEHMNLLSEDLYKKWMKEEIQYGDIFLTSEAPLGEHILRKSNEKLVLSQRIFGIRTKKDKLDSTYFNYFIDSDYYQHELKSRESGSTVTGIKQSELIKTKLLLPPLREQRAIATVLSSFDDKIELLREENKTLEATAQTIFKEWFGKYKVGDELPEGWKIGKLGDIIENFDSQRVPVASDERATRKGKYPYYGATSINDYVDDYLFNGTYVLLGEDGSVMKENGKPFTQYVWGKIWVNNHAHVLQGRNGFSTEMIKIILDTIDIAPFVSGAVQLKITQGNMNRIPVIISDSKTLEKFDNIISPIFAKIRENEEQIQSLAKARDTLLPKLMKGDVRVNF